MNINYIHVTGLEKYDAAYLYNNIMYGFNMVKNSNLSISNESNIWWKERKMEEIKGGIFLITRTEQDCIFKSKDNLFINTSNNKL